METLWCALHLSCKTDHWIELRDRLAQHVDQPVCLTRIKELDLNYEYPQKIDRKPRGLWFSIGTEWFDWLTSQDEWGTERLEIYSRAVVFDVDYTDVLIVNTVEQMDAFINEFVLAYDTKDPDPEYQKIMACVMGMYNWEAVKNRYKGIMVTNKRLMYQMDNYELVSPFYGWDVIGGCIWDLSVISGLKQVYEV